MFMIAVVLQKMMSHGLTQLKRAPQVTLNNVVLDFVCLLLFCFPSALVDDFYNE